MYNHSLQPWAWGALVRQEPRKAGAAGARSVPDRMDPSHSGPRPSGGQDAGRPGTEQDASARTVAGPPARDPPRPSRSVEANHAWGRWCW